MSEPEPASDTGQSSTPAKPPTKYKRTRDWYSRVEFPKEQAHVRDFKLHIFVEKLAQHGNATRAAYEAGLGGLAPHVAGYRLTLNQSVMDAVYQRRAEAMKRAEVDEDRIVQGLLAEAESYGPDATPQTRIAAWKVLAQWKGMLQTRVEHMGSVQLTPSLEDVQAYAERLQELADQQKHPTIIIKPEPQALPESPS